MAFKMALDLGISEEMALQTIPSYRQRLMLRTTWQTVYQLYNMASSS
jgi:hypothetical protein